MDLMAEQPTQWTKLKCDSCGSIYFRKKLHLITRAGGGTTEEVAGYTCRACDADVDQARMIQRLELERKKAELKQLQTEVEASDPKEPVTGGRSAKA